MAPRRFFPVVYILRESSLGVFGFGFGFCDACVPLL